MHGIAALRLQVRVLVIVDVLSFSTAVDVALSRGAAVRPFADRESAMAAVRPGTILAGTRRTDGFTLSPASLQTLPEGVELMLPSPNGATLSLACGDVQVFAACLRNAEAVAAAAQVLAGDGDIGVVPAGERWPDGSLRPAIEDLLGAGAVIHHLTGPASPEAALMAGAFRTARADIAAILAGSTSGRELHARGFAADVALAAECGVSTTAPCLQGGTYRPS
jgi:2-phosphosulfolactate phosphatase